MMAAVLLACVRIGLSLGVLLIAMLGKGLAPGLTPGFVIGNGGLAGLLKLVPRDPVFLGVVAAGAVVVALAVGAYQWLVSARDRSKSLPFLEMVKGAAGLAPVIADPAKRARLDDLRKKFEEGTEKFRAAGKDIYALPWYLLVGPAGSGKTEAMRHSNVGFPPGLQDYLQGAGGTLNMHWWFTNHAVVLDTAGRMFMEDASSSEGGGGGSEWQEFLSLLKKTRPHTPINGMLLVIGADSLIKDSSGEIESKAGRIARQLDTIQRALDVRFPVYVVVTKCDLIAGFREFFDGLGDPTLQHQMLGWSNPGGLDEPLRPELLEEHMKSVRRRLERRRLGLVLDPTRQVSAASTGGAGVSVGGGGISATGAALPGAAKRIDEIDALYALPEQLERMTPKLRRYLELIFAGGEWSPKPLFLRGIYFTSSMREGEALDQDLAKALGVPLEKLPGGKVWEKERSFFLRDVFMSKAFREKGLVTRHVSVQRQQRNRRLMLIGGVGGSAAAVLGLAIYGQWQLSRSVEAPREFWSAVRKAEAPVIRFETPRWMYVGDRKDVELPEGEIARAALTQRTAARAATPIPVPVVFAPAAGLAGAGGGFVEEQRRAHAVKFEQSVLVPLVEAARRRLVDDAAAGAEWTPRATAALAELVRLHTLASGGRPASGVAQGVFDPAPLAAYVLEDEAAVPERTLQEWRVTIGAIYDGSSGAVWPPAGLRASDASSVRLLRDSIARWTASWEKRLAGDDYELGRLAMAGASIDAFSSEFERFLNTRGLPGAGVVKTRIEFAALRDEVAARADAMKQAAQGVKLGDASVPMDDRIDSAGAAMMKSVAAELEMLKKELPAEDAVLSGTVAEVAKSLQDSAAAFTGMEAAATGRVRETVRAHEELSAAAGAGRGKEPVLAIVLEAVERAVRESDEFEALAKASAAGPVASQSVVQPTGQSAASAALASTVTSLREVQQRRDRAVAELESVVRAIPEGSLRDRARNACAALITLSGSAAAALVLEKFYTEIPADVPGVEELVRTLDAANGGKALTPSIPLTVFDGTVPTSPRYSPKGAALLLEALSAADALRRGDRDMIDGDRLAELSESRGRGVAEYARGFAVYWTSGIARDASLRAGLEGWSEYAAALRGAIEGQSAPGSGRGSVGAGLRAAEVNAELRSLTFAGLGAIEPLPASVKAEPQIAAAIARAGAMARTLGDDAATRAVQDAVETLRPVLAMDWREARAAILAEGGAGSARVAALRLLGGPDSPEYWRSLASGLLRAIRGEFEPQGREALKVLRESARWPLARDGAGRDGVAREGEASLTLDQIAAASNAAKLLLANPAGEDVAPATTDGVGNNEVDRLIADLRSGRLLDGGQRRRTAEILKVASAFAPGALESSLVPVWEDAELDVLPSLVTLGIRTAGNASEWFEQVEVVRLAESAVVAGAAGEAAHDETTLGERIGLRVIDAEGAARLASSVRFASPGGAVLLRFYRNFGDKVPAAESTLIGPWPAASAVLLPGVQGVEGTQGRSWFIPLPVKEIAQGRTYHLWLKLTADRALPDPAAWPSAEQWPR